MADVDGPEPDEPAPDESEIAPVARMAGTRKSGATSVPSASCGPAARVRGSSRGLASPRTEPSPVARSEATKAAVNNLDQTERRIGIVATVVELALTVVVVVPYLMHNHKMSSSELKTMSAVHVFLIEGIVLVRLPAARHDPEAQSSRRFRLASRRRLAGADQGARGARHRLPRLRHCGSW